MPQSFILPDAEDETHVSIEYWRSFTYIFENPNWLKTVLFLAICQLIPIAGPIATLGYQFEVAESLLRRTSPGGYADFDFNRFPDYLIRGLWPFLVVMVAVLVLIVPLTVLGIGVFVAVALMVEAAGPGDAEPLAFAMIGIGLLLLIAISFGLNLVLVPMSLRAGYSQDFGQAFHFGFVWDFVGRMWLETVLSMLFLGICSIPLVLAGMLCCGFGVYFTIPLAMLAQAHLMDFQLYAVYLARGGEPIPCKPA